MGPFLTGFADELIKVGAFPQQHQDPDPYDATSGVASTMNKSQGTEARVGLKSGMPVQTAPAIKKLAPTPLTSPNHMVDYSSRG